MPICLSTLHVDVLRKRNRRDVKALSSLQELGADTVRRLHRTVKEAGVCP